MTCEIGIIGGSGLYDMEELADRREVTLETPFGAPSGPYVTATLRGRRVAFLARHGAGHRLLPGELNFRANIFGFKLLGVERILSASAVGSLREDYRPLDIVVPDQFFDRTRGRISTFFGGGLVAHVGAAEPFCSTLSAQVYEAVKSTGATVPTVAPHRPLCAGVGPATAPCHFWVEPLPLSGRSMMNPLMTSA